MSLERLQEERLELLAPSHPEAMDSAQATTNDFVIVPESILDCTGHDTCNFVVSNAHATNVVAAKIVGRYKNRANAYSAWQDASGGSASGTVAGSSQTALTPDSLPFDQVAVMVESNVDDSHGSIDAVYGCSKRLN